MNVKNTVCNLLGLRMARSGRMFLKASTNKGADMNILCFLLETEMRGTEEKGLDKIRCSHRWVKNRYLKYFSSPAMCQLLMLIVRHMLMKARTRVGWLCYVTLHYKTTHQPLSLSAGCNSSVAQINEGNFKFQKTKKRGFSGGSIAGGGLTFS